MKRTSRARRRPEGFWLGVLLSLVSAGGADQLRAAPEEWTKNSLVGLQIEGPKGPTIGGRAFTLGEETPARPLTLLITVDHVLGATSKEVVAVTAIPLNDLRGAPLKAERLFLDCSDTSTTEGEADALALFVVTSESQRKNVLRLADTPPKPGDTVWLWGRRSDESPLILNKAKVIREDGVQTDFRLATAEPGLDGWSGSPLLNDQGEVVGVLVGQARANGRLYGRALSWQTLRRQSREALRMGAMPPAF